MRETPRLRLINKPKRKRWYSVVAQFELEDAIERAKFKHPGDAYKYAAKLQDDYKYYAVPLLLVTVEC